MNVAQQSVPVIDPAKVEFIVIDLEGTSREPAETHIVEWASVRMTPEFFGEGGISEPFCRLVRPPIPIPAETSAIHHIIDADVADASPWENWAPIVKALLSNANTVAVAHNAQYESTALASLEVKAPWLCTYKAALRVWPECPSHSNECLRYWLGLGGGRSSKQAPHSAGHDAMVTAQILKELLSKASLADMLRWTNEPAMLPRCPIGVWRDHPWAEVDEGFLDWILYKARDMREDIIFCARTEVERRQKVRLAEMNARRIAAGVATVAISDDDDLPF